MKKQGVVDIVGQEIQRLRQEAAELDRQIDEWTARRNRLQMLIAILEAHQDLPAPARQQVLKGLSGNRLPERKTGSVQKVSRTAPRKPDLQVGRPARMLEGIYAGLEGVIRWCRESPRGTICTLSLRSPAGRAVRTQVTERSLGRKWVVLDAPGQAEPGNRAASPVRASAGTRKGKKTRKPGQGGGPRRATRPAELLPRNTRVRVLKGKYAGWEGVVSGIRDKKTAITYALNLVGPGGEEGRTQVNHGSLGISWVLADTPSIPRNEPPAPPPKVVRRRPGQATDAENGRDQDGLPDVSAGTPEAAFREDPLAEPSRNEEVRSGEPSPPAGAAAESPAPRYTPASPVLQEKTRIRMLSGPHLGHEGIIVRVQQHPGPKADAIYTILIETGPDGDTVLTSARHSSLGRSWTVL